MRQYSDFSRELIAFMTLKIIVFQIKKKTFFNFAILFLLLSGCYLVSLITGQLLHFCCQMKISKGEKYDIIVVKGRFPKEIKDTQSNVFKEFVDFTGFDTKKK